MTQKYRDALQNANVLAFLRVIRHGESSQDEDAYRWLFGSTRSKPKTFDSFDDHPRVRTYEVYDGQFIKNGKLDFTTAAGAYQITESTWGGCSRALGLTDFSPESQDLAAVYLIDGRKALSDVLAGRVESAIDKLGQEWASLSSSMYGQPTVKLADALRVYSEYGGTFSAEAPSQEPAPVVEEKENQVENESTASKIIGSPATKFLLAAVHPLLAVVPEIAKMFMDRNGETVPERNVAAAVKLVETAQKALQGPGEKPLNAQAVVERIEANPAAKELVRQAVLSDPYWLMTEAGSGGIGGARKADYMMVTTEGPWWQVLRSPSFWAMIFLLPLVYIIVLSLVGSVGTVVWSADARAGIAGMITGSIVGGLVGYYYGQSTSRNRSNTTETEPPRSAGRIE